MHTEVRTTCVAAMTIARVCTGHDHTVRRLDGGVAYVGVVLGSVRVYPVLGAAFYGRTMHATLNVLCRGPRRLCRWEGWFAASSEQISAVWANEELPLHGGHRLMVRGHRDIVNELAEGLDVRLNDPVKRIARVDGKGYVGQWRYHRALCLLRSRQSGV